MNQKQKSGADTENTHKSQSFVQFGAGNIGRSFIGQLFSRADYEVIFVDIDDALIEGLNAAGAYDLVVKEPDGDRRITIDHVRAIHSGNREAVSQAVAEASYIATSVGSGVLKHIFPVLAAGLQQRKEPVDIIIAENMRRGAEFFKDGLSPYLPKAFPFSRRVGLVETSIGKMVPIMTREDRAQDPLQVFSEAYNTLIVDASGFITEIPPLEGLKAVDHIDAYVDRKLFVHNLGHAAAAYLGHVSHPEAVYIREVLEDPELLREVRLVMQEGGNAVLKAYPESFNQAAMNAHIEDLLSRFRNPSLGDTLFRVGRDLHRKLGKNDRIIGAMLLASRKNLPFDHIAGVYRAALSFHALGEDGKPDEKDAAFYALLSSSGADYILREVSGLSAQDAGNDAEVSVAEMLRKRIQDFQDCQD